MNRRGKVIVCFFCIVVVFLVGLLISNFVSPKKVELNPGWQLIEVDGKVPKGAIVIVNFDSNAVLPDEDLVKRATGFISKGRINFYESMWLTTQALVWVYYPENYEFIQKKDDFNKQCLEKLSNLTKKTETSMDEYDVGHP